MDKFVSKTPSRPKGAGCFPGSADPDETSPDDEIYAMYLEGGTASPLRPAAEEQGEMNKLFAEATKLDEHREAFRYCFRFLKYSTQSRA